MNSTYEIRRATADDFRTIIGLIDEASRWLKKDKRSDQWQRPWPSREGRDLRIMTAIENHHTWILWDRGDAATETAVATISVERDGNPLLWNDLERLEPAVYVNRLVVSRRYAGDKLGEELLAWAAQQAYAEYEARWVRIDVWTTNQGLHDYYRRQGFVYHRAAEVPGYPSDALFQLDTSIVLHTDTSRIQEAATALIP